VDVTGQMLTLVDVTTLGGNGARKRLISPLRVRKARLCRRRLLDVLAAFKAMMLLFI